MRELCETNEGKDICGNRCEWAGRGGERGDERERTKRFLFGRRIFD